MSSKKNNKQHENYDDYYKRYNDYYNSGTSIPIAVSYPAKQYLLLTMDGLPNKKINIHPAHVLILAFIIHNNLLCTGPSCIHRRMSSWNTSGSY